MARLSFFSGKDNAHFRGVEELASEARKAAAKRGLNSLYEITTQLSGQSNTCTKPVKDKEGKVITSERGKGWKIDSAFQRSA